MAIKLQATIEDLYATEGKAELVDGELLLMSPTGHFPAYAAGEIFSSLREYARKTGRGFVFTDSAAFLVDLPRRRSFSPDAAFYTGPSAGMKFLPQAPDFAVEVRSEGDYGPKAERDMARKRADYFAAGTLVVWDVDLLSDEVIKVYKAANPVHPSVYRKGETAEAEPAVAGWSMPVDDLFL